MTRFRARIGEATCSFMLGLTIKEGIATKTVAVASVAVINVDTTARYKAIAHPTDARLYFHARAALVRISRKSGIVVKPSFERLGGKRVLMMNTRYAHAR